MRHKLLFFSIILMAIPVLIFSQVVIQVAEGENVIDGAMLTAAAGDTIELITDGGVYNEDSTIVIDIPITIRAAAGLTDRPTWTCDDASRNISVFANLTLDGIIFDGSLGDALTKDCVRTDSTEGLVLKVNNCVFRNFNDGSDGHGIKGKKEAKLDTLIVTNSRFEHIPGENISYKDGTPDYPAGPIKYTLIENCTFWDGENEAIYIEDADDDSSTDPQPEIIINHLTVVGFNDKPIYPRAINGAVVKNSISVGHIGSPGRIYNLNSVLTNFLYYDCGAEFSLEDDATYDTDLVLEDQNPYFADTENGDFAVAAGSPAALFGNDGFALGDTNNGTWDAANITEWEIVENNDWATLIKNAVSDGDTITFVTDGGEYYTPENISTKEYTLTFRAMPGLVEKPVLTVNYWESYLLKIHGPSTVKGLCFQGNGMLNHPDSTGGDVTGYLLYWEDEGQHYGTTIVEDCDFYSCRLRAINTDDKNTFDTLIVNNCYFEEIGETVIYGKEAVRNIDYARITNNTFYKFGQKGIYLRDVGELEIYHNTFLYCDSTLSGRTGGHAIRTIDDSLITVRDNIFAKIEDEAVLVDGPAPVVEYNLFWLCDSLIKNEHDPTMIFPVFNDVGDPIFRDTTQATLDLAVEINGSAYLYASDGTNLGDPRWGEWDVTGIKEDGLKVPQTYALHQNYPNPFNPSTTIVFELAQAGDVSLNIYNILGQHVATVLDQNMNIGQHKAFWDAEQLSAGIYFYKIKVNGFSKVHKMLLVK